MTEEKQAPMQGSLEDLKKQFAPEPKVVRRKANILLAGDMGTGKTQALATARRPIWIHSFDPTGMDTIREQIDNNDDIVSDERFEKPGDPNTFILWDKVFHQMKNSKAFDKIGTFALDSATTWGDSIMSWVLQQAGRLGKAPWQNDYPDQMARINAAILSLMELPCDVIFIAHLDLMKNDVTGQIHTVPMITGKLRSKVPTLFSEVWIATRKSSPDGSKYQILTQTDGHYNARTRLGNNGKLDKWEEPNITNMLKKCGLE